MTDHPSIVREEITIAVDTDTCTPLTLELAVELAVSLKGQLRGIFIENADLLSTSKLPFSREITLSTGQPRALNPDIVENSFRRMARQFEQLLEQKARQAVVHFSFQAMPGRRQDVFKLDSPSGYLILERKANKPQWSSSSGFPHKRILVVDGVDQFRLDTALTFLLRKFPHHKMDVYWLGNPPQEKRSAQSARMKIQPVAVESVDTLLHSNLDYVLVSRLVEPSLLNTLLTESSCPVIVAN